MTEPLDDARGELLALIKSAYYQEPTGTAENAWNAALEHIQEGLSRPAPVPQCEAEPGDDSQHYLALMGLTSYVVANFPRADQWIQGGRPVLKDAKEALAAPPSRSDAESAPVAWREAVESFIEQLRPVQQVFNRDGTVQASWAVDGRKWFTLDFTEALRILENASLVSPPSGEAPFTTEQLDALQFGRLLHERPGDLTEKIKRIDTLLARDDEDSGYSAFVFMRKLWPQIKAALSPDPGTVAVASAQYRCTCGAESYCAPNVHDASCPLAISSTHRGTP